MRSLHPLLVAERKSVTERASVRAAQPSRLSKRVGDHPAIGSVFAHFFVLALCRLADLEIRHSLCSERVGAPTEPPLRLLSTAALEAVAFRCWAASRPARSARRCIRRCPPGLRRRRVPASTDRRRCLKITVRIEIEVRTETAIRIGASGEEPPPLDASAGDPSN
jgi:hypothetical protein